MTGIKGNLYWWFNGAVNLSAGYAKLRLFCTNPLQASGAVIVYVSVGLTDLTSGIVSGSGGPGTGAYLWSTNTASCTHAGSTRFASSPALSFAFNSSTYGLGGMFIQHQHTYLLTAYIGCEVVATVYNASAPVAVSGSCNNAGDPSLNTFSVTRLGIT
jgi:hypothetical protein